MVKLTAAGVALLCSTIVNAVPSRRQLSRNTPLYPRNTQPQTYINASRNDDSPVFLRIDTTDISARNATAPDLYGIMFEDINHSGDGGIYGELIVNRAFQGNSWAATACFLGAEMSRLWGDIRRPSTVRW